MHSLICMVYLFVLYLFSVKLLAKMLSSFNESHRFPISSSMWPMCVVAQLMLATDGRTNIINLIVIYTLLTKEMRVVGWHNNNYYVNIQQSGMCADGRFDCGSGMALIRTTNVVEVGKWNTAVIARHYWNGWVKLNDGEKNFGRSKVNNVHNVFSW